MLNRSKRNSYPPPQKAQRLKKKQKQESIFREAWNNMSNDMSTLLPEKLQKRKGKKKFFILFVVLELLVLGVVGKVIYNWVSH